MSISFYGNIFEAYLYNSSISLILFGRGGAGGVAFGAQAPNVFAKALNLFFV